MKVLVLSCNTGGGHNACARAIREQFQSAGDICDIADAVGFCSKSLSQFITWGHSTMYRHFPRLFSFGYEFSEKHPGILKDDSIIYKLLTGGAEKLHCFLENEKYDAVVCTHVFSGLLLRETLSRYSMKLKTAFVPTDYTCSPGTAKSNADLYFIPAESLREEFVEQGVPADKIIVSGIPVRAGFYARMDTNAAKRNLNIEPSRFHILMMCGSMGCGPMERLVKQAYIRMKHDCEISVVCGRNEKLQRKLNKVFRDVNKVHVYGFMEDMNVLMDSADICVTKPGGLSTSEAAAKGLPMILLDVVSGCEERNMDYFVRCGGAVTALCVDGVVGHCLVLANERLKLEKMGNALVSQLPKNAADSIVKSLHKEMV